MNDDDRRTPEHWTGLGGALDEVTRAARGTVYDPPRRRRAARLAWLATALVIVLVVAGIITAAWLADLLGL